MSLFKAPPAYSQDDQDRLRSELDRMDGLNRKKGQDVDMAGSSLILTSPNGSRFAVVVDDAGNLSTVAA